MITWNTWPPGPPDHLDQLEHLDYLDHPDHLADNCNHLDLNQENNGRIRIVYLV